jgi:hypothetical protein
MAADYCWLVVALVGAAVDWLLLARLWRHWHRFAEGFCRALGAEEESLRRASLPIFAATVEHEFGVFGLQHGLCLKLVKEDEP